MKRVVTLPRMSFYTQIIKQLLENLGVAVMLPPPITEKTIKLGVKHSSPMMCYPFKITLGSFIEALEMAKRKGIKLTYLGVGTSNVCMSSCRFQQYFEIQKKICEDLGYDFDTIFIERKGTIFFGVLSAFKRVNPKNSYPKVVRELIKAVKLMHQEEKKNEYFDWNDQEKIRIGIVGEFYTVVESSINYNIFNKLRNRGVNVHTFVKYSNELKRGYKGEVPTRFVKEAKKYYKGMFRAHGDPSHHALYFYKHHNFDAVIHLMPLSCMPETTSEMIMDLTAKRLDLPLYRFEIDETNSEANINTRLEASVELLQRKKGVK
ncbi:MAG: hypothetical protein KAX20_01380 [Candidatus Omnitrophica bacterium]|nr:hypothetical protein [Candidatus Omnitrophota bacterium]